MSKPTSTISSAVSIRISNDLLDSIREYAIAHNLINNSGRPDKRGEPNLSQAFSELVRLGLGQEITVSDSVSNPANNDLRNTVTKLSDSVSILSDKLKERESRLEAVLNQVEDLRLKVHSQETYSLLYDHLKADVDIRFDATNKAIAALTSEVKVSHKKAPDAVPETEGDSNAEITGEVIEADGLPIIEAIANIAAPMIEPQSRQNLTELSESEKNNVLDNVLTQIILDENKPKTKMPDETFTDAIANTAAPSIDNPLPDETFTDAIASTAKQKKITYRLNRDGSVILGSIVGTSIKVLKRMTDDELKAIGIFRTLRGKDEKFFPINPDAIAVTAKPKSTRRSPKTPKPKATTPKPKAKKLQAVDDRRFTSMAAAAYYRQKTGQPLKETTLIQNAKQYGFAILERGTGLYALIDDSLK